LPARWTEIQAIWDELAAELSPQQRAAFVLREIEELPVRDVAKALKCSVSTVRSHISLARKTLRVALKERFPELARPEAGKQDG
jgi:RNA polymerase sigma-70 factor (ECF subfamily)